MRLPFYVGTGVLLGVALANPALLHLPPAAGGLALVLVVLWIVWVGRSSMRRQLRTARQCTRAVEAVQLEDWALAHTTLYDLLSRPVVNPVVRAQGLLGLAAVADHHHDYPSSQLIYEHLLRDSAGQPPQLHAAAVGLATAMLRNDQLTDAVQLIDQLSRAAREAPPVWAAQVELLQLYREVMMGQYDDVLAASARRRELFRGYLSTRSGYGYALLALGHHRRGQPQQANRLWHDATLLIHPDKLLDRFPMLGDLVRHYPACEVRL